MNTNRKADYRRRNIAGVVAIVLGLAIGLFIKRVPIGLLIGIILGFVVYSLLGKR